VVTLDLGLGPPMFWRPGKSSPRRAGLSLFILWLPFSLLNVPFSPSKKIGEFKSDGLHLSSLGTTSPGSSFAMCNAPHASCFVPLSFLHVRYHAEPKATTKLQVCGGSPQAKHILRGVPSKKTKGIDDAQKPQEIRSCKRVKKKISVIRNSLVDTVQDDILHRRAYIAPSGKIERVSCLSKLMKILVRYQALQKTARSVHNYYHPEPTWNTVFQ